jgi:leader peptidase (prepilin peptidase)/N-methyltransferase
LFQSDDGWRQVLWFSVILNVNLALLNLLPLPVLDGGHITLSLIEAVRGEAGVGGGDARLFAVTGLWLGLSALPGCLIYASLSALAAAIISLRRGVIADSQAPLPFGPHLALGLWLSYTLGPLEFG